jgi:carbon storage regulator
MLILTRGVGEEILIGKHVRITTLEIQGNRVRLGIVAPENVQVDRQEVHRRKRAECEVPACARGAKNALAPPNQVTTPNVNEA